MRRVVCMLFPLVGLMVLEVCTPPGYGKGSAEIAEVEDFILKPQIAGGSDAPDGKFGFVVAVGLLKGKKFTSYCGGSLIEKGWIVTAAHCAGSNGVAVGRRDLAKDDGVVYKVPQGNSFCYRDPTVHDIALIRLPVSVDSSRVRPVALAKDSSWEAGRPSMALAGWGKGARSTKLQELRVELEPSRCIKVFGVHPGSSFCTFSPKGVALGRDSGGPVLIDNGEILVGVMERVGEDRETGELLNKHTKITPYLEWIRHLMANQVIGGDTIECG